MIPGRALETRFITTFPRTRGDDPMVLDVCDEDGIFSPHPRG